MQIRDKISAIAKRTSDGTKALRHRAKAPAGDDDFGAKATIGVKRIGNSIITAMGQIRKIIAALLAGKGMEALQINDKLVTAVCRTTDGFEWSCLKVKPEGSESAGQGSLAVSVDSDSLETLQLPEETKETLQGDLTIAMRTSELLLRTMEFPTADPQEITDMVDFQIDKVSPFPMDQLAVSHEVLQQSEDSALVLMAATKRENIDSIGDTFGAQGVHIHSIDARVLGWLQLLRSQDHIAGQGCEILIINDHIELTLIILLEGQPVAFRTLHADIEDPGILDELTQEMSYTLTMLETEHNIPEPSSIQFWRQDEVPAALAARLSKQAEIQVFRHNLNDLPPLSEGILHRATDEIKHLELIPREWIELQQRKRLFRKAIIATSSIAAVWLVTLLIFFSIYKARDVQLNRAQKEAEEIAPAAKTALENRNKLKALKVFTDRSDSALECLREVTNMLPDGDIEFVSYNYKKNKGVTMRGTADTDDKVYDFFKTLTDSKLFTQLKDQSVNTKTTKGVRRAVFSATLELSAEEGAK